MGKVEKNSFARQRWSQKANTFKTVSPLLNLTLKGVLDFVAVGLVLSRLC